MAQVRLKKENKTIKVVNRKDTIRLKQVEENIKLQHVGKPGPAGEPGAPGADGKDGLGVPPGGSAGQVLSKVSGDDNDTAWLSFDAADKSYVQNFNISSFQSVNHGMNKYPAVTVHDSAGDEVEGEVVHIDLNNLTVAFSAPFSGRITCN